MSEPPSTPRFASVAEAVLRVYTNLMHRLEVHGRENLPTPEQRRAERADVGGGHEHNGDGASAQRGLIVVGNHTAGIDALLLQSAMEGHYVRWVMGRDMAEPSLHALWDWCRVIMIDRSGKADLPAMREMIRALQNGEIVGLFPEGRLPEPGAPLGEFLPGLGLLVSRTKALVLPAVISGTPQASTPWGSLWRRSRSVVRFMPVIDYAAIERERGRPMKPAEIMADLRERFEAWRSTEARV